MKKALTFLEILKLNEKNRIENFQVNYYDNSLKPYSKDQVCCLYDDEYFCIKICYKKLKDKYPNDHFIHIAKGKGNHYIYFYTVSLMKKIKWKLCPRKFFKI